MGLRILCPRVRELRWVWSGLADLVRVLLANLQLGMAGRDLAEDLRDARVVGGIPRHDFAYTAGLRADILSDSSGGFRRRYL